MIINILVYYEEFLRKCNEIWDKVKDLLKKEFDSEQVHNSNKEIFRGIEICAKKEKENK